MFRVLQWFSVFPFLNNDDDVDDDYAALCSCSYNRIAMFVMSVATPRHQVINLHTSF